jgi:large subunit ribosomal protein L24
MKLRKDDQVVVILGRDKGKTGKITRVMPADNMVVVENINIIKRHTKPSNKQPRGGILEITKPIHVSKVMVIDPGSGRPARISYDIKQDGSKERIFKVSRKLPVNPAKISKTRNPRLARPPQEIRSEPL